MQITGRIVVALGLLQMGCGAVPGEEHGLEGGEGELGSEEAALNETGYDRQVAAATVRVVNGESQLWLFACSSNNYMKMRVQSAGVWSGWTSLNGSAEFKCAGPPSVGRMLDTPRDLLGVYWRSASNKLIEGWFRPNGTHQVMDVTTYEGYDDISSNPTVAGVNDDNNWISIVVREASTNEMYSIDWYHDAYVRRPLLLAGGQTFSQTFTTTPVASYAAFTRDFVSVQANAGAHFVFARTGWTSHFTQHAWTAAAPVEGVLSLGGYLISGTCSKFGCALARDATNDNLMWAPLQNGGNLNNLFETFNSWDMGGSPGQADRGKSSRTYSRASNGELVETNNWNFNSGTIISVPGKIVSGVTVAPQVDWQVYFASNAHGTNRLYHFDGIGRSFEDMGLDVRAP
jgi:hypothetical protein